MLDRTHRQTCRALAVVCGSWAYVGVERSAVATTLPIELDTELRVPKTTRFWIKSGSKLASLGTLLV